MKFAFIAQQRQRFTVTAMCRVLSVSSSGYYAAQQRQTSRRSQENQRLLLHMRLIHRVSRGTYGYRRLYHELREQGIGCGRHRIARLMRQNDLHVKYRRPYKRTTQASLGRLATPNLLAQDFMASAVNQKWVADMTYIPTAEGWLYLAVVMDLFSRQIVGWSMDVRMKTTLVSDALHMACLKRRPSNNLLHHSDRGSQYTSHAYQKLLAHYGFQVSLSRSGNCYDNAAMESFFATLKTECLDKRFSTRDAARVALFEFIELWYNSRRRHSTLGYLSPQAFERQAAADIFTLH
jgi:transposase InsO family protein